MNLKRGFAMPGYPTEADIETAGVYEYTSRPLIGDGRGTLRNFPLAVTRQTVSEYDGRDDGGKVLRSGDAGEASVPNRRLFLLGSSLSARINKDEAGDTHAMRRPRIRDCNCAVAIIGNNRRHVAAWPHRNRAGVRRRAWEFEPGVGAP
jgi:hypothetical protein